MVSSYIAIDWGSTNLRAWFYRDGECQQTRRSEAGVTRLNGRSHQQIFDDITQGWPVGELPVVMAGMVGSNAGWIPAPYLSCPLMLESIATQLTHVGEKRWIVPGLSINRSDNHNVIRGEETQLLGAQTLAPAAVTVMPGTHAKWVVSEDDYIVDFRTVMTGELHHLLLKQSLIGNGLPEQHQDAQAFQRGLETGINDTSILPRLFEVRAQHLLGALSRESVSDFLSGLLIGHEVSSQQRQLALAGPVTLVASPQLTQRYQQAFTMIDTPTQWLDGDRAFQQGIRRIADALTH
ncbi:2-dehydro-3-deoxygalactonokinase [Mixta mediterraneensis]|uniref:2-dehydro-3-deoxygalactonokinase n=1 Tax=Mixta mediterraneensis TaxID=2758443 RepID=UPI00187575C2|nr:2-dehydro-3-deoxygalactonokinase [Mixta mediterraneensis]